MTKVAILPESSPNGVGYRAVAGQQQSFGATPGQAFDALATQLPEDNMGTVVIVQQMQPDRFFSAAQQSRLEELMARWRAARDAGTRLPADEQDELDSLVEAEVKAATERATALLHELER